MNKQCAMYCIDLIRAVMQEKAVPPMPAGISLKALYAFAKLHGVEAMVHHGVAQLRVEETDSVLQEWDRRADMILTQSIVQLAERDKLFSAMHDAGIPVLPVKGSWLKELYPEIDYRQMSDLDILIRPEDAKKAKSVMLQLGYFPSKETSDHHNGYSLKPYMEVELHLSLLPDSSEHYDYYKNIWEKATESDYPGVFRLSPEDEYIYYLLHLQNHVLFAGSGIRSFLDCVVYRELYPHMDMEYLMREYEALGITSFVRDVEALSDCWFRTGSIPGKELDALSQAVISAGTYGTEEQQFRNQMAKVSSVTPARYWLSRLFLSKKEMEKEFPVLKKLPMLLPLMWFVRLVSRLTRHPKALLRHIKLVNRIGKENG